MHNEFGQLHSRFMSSSEPISEVVSGKKIVIVKYLERDR